MKNLLALIIFCSLPVLLHGQLQWAQTRSPYAIDMIIVGNHILVGNNDGIYLSKDNAASWISVFDNPLNCFVANENVIYAGTNLGCYISYDRGLTWITFNNLLSDKRIISMCIKDGQIFASGESRIYNSVDKGKTWVVINSIGIQPKGAFILSQNDSVIFAGTPNSSSYGTYLLRSIDNGKTWINSFNGIKDQYIQTIATKGSTIFVGTKSHGIYRSLDNGNSWLEVSTGLIEKDIRKIIVNNDAVFAITSFSSVYRTYNGEIWQLLQQKSSDLISHQGNLYGASLGGFYYSNNNGNGWDILNSRTLIDANHLYNSDENELLASTPNGLWLSKDNGTHWKNINPRKVNVSIKIGNTILVSENTGIYRSTDNGITWSMVKVTNGEAISIVSDGSILYCLDARTLYRSVDNGLTWEEVKIGIQDLLSYTSIFVRDSKIFIGKSDKGIYRSLDNGKTWSLLTNGLKSIYTVNINCFVANDSFLFAGTSNGIFRSSDNGDSWIAVNNNLSGSYLNITALISSGEVIYAGTQRAGVFRTENNGLSWTADNKGLLRSSEYITSFSLVKPYIIASVSKGGTFRSLLQPTTSVANNTKSDAFLTVVKCYPNPITTDKLMIEISALTQGKIQIEILSFASVTLMQSNFKVESTSIYNEEINVSDLSSGLYYVRVKFGNELIVKPFIRLK